MSPRYPWSFLGKMALLHTWRHHTQGELYHYELIKYEIFATFSALGGEQYMESVNCGGNIAMMTFHAGIIRKIFDKLGMVAITGPLNVGKTKELKVRKFTLLILSCSCGLNHRQLI